VTLSIFAGLLQIICVEAVIGVVLLATSLWWAACERLNEEVEG
jgi:hypothetical protein